MAVTIDIRKDVEEALLKVLNETKLIESIKTEIAKITPVQEDRWLTKKEAARHIGVSESTFDRFRKEFPHFPKGRKLGNVNNSRVVWRKSELDAFMETLPQEDKDA